MGLWVSVLTSGALLWADNCQHVAAAIVMRESANSKRRPVCGGGGGICLICSHASLLPPCSFAPSQHSCLTYLLTHSLT